MAAKRIPDLTAISGASTANDDNLVIFDTDANETKRILRSQLAEALASDISSMSLGVANLTVSTLSANTVVLADANKKLISAPVTGSGSVVFDTAPTISAPTLTSPVISTGNQNFGGTAQRITGDMSNATFANRLAFQTSTTNGTTTISALPNGTATVSLIAAFNNSDPTNGSYVGLLATATEARVQSARLGTGTFLPLKFYTSSAEQGQFDVNGNFVVGTAALALNAANGFLYVPTCPGTPTGTPTSYPGRSPLVVDSTNNKLYFYSNGVWRDAGP